MDDKEYKIKISLVNKQYVDGLKKAAKDQAAFDKQIQRQAVQSAKYILYQAKQTEKQRTAILKEETKRRIALERQAAREQAAIEKEAERNRKARSAYIGKVRNVVGNYGGAVIGYGMYKVTQDIVNMDKALVRLRIDSGMSATETMRFKEAVYNTAIATGQTTDDIIKLSQSSFESSKSIGFVNKELAFMAKVMAASGAEAGALGEAIGSIHEKTGATGKEIEDFISQLYSFGKTTGKEQTLKQILPNIPQMLTTIKSIAPQAGLAQIGEYITGSMFLENPAFLEKAVRRMASGQGQKVLGALGMRTKQGELPSLFKVVDRIMKSGPRSLDLMQKVFGRNELFVRKLVTEYDAFNKAMQESKVNKVFDDASISAHSLSGSFNNLQTAARKFGDAALTGGINKIAEAFSKMSSDDVNNIAKAFEFGGKAIAKSIEGWLKLLGYINDLRTINKASIKSQEEKYGFPGVSVNKSSQPMLDWMLKILSPKETLSAKNNKGSAEDYARAWQIQSIVTNVQLDGEGKNKNTTTTITNKAGRNFTFTQ